MANDFFAGANVIRGIDPNDGISQRNVAVSSAGVVSVNTTATVAVGADTPADGKANPTTSFIVTGMNEGFNNTTWDRLRTASAANLAAQSGLGSLLAVAPGNWTASNPAAAGTLASASKTAGAAGVRHVCTSVSFTWATDGTANGAAQQIVCVLRDGATGAGTVLHTWTPNRTTTTVTDQNNNGSFALSGLNIVGTAATAMTVEFTGTASNHTIYTANLTGYDAS